MENKFDYESKIVVDSIKELCENPESLENFQCYLAMHFDIWLEKYAFTPDRMAEEFKMFASIR